MSSLNEQKTEWTSRAQDAKGKIDENFSQIIEKRAAAKKETLLHKAVHEFGRKDVEESMGLELLGVVKRKRSTLKKLPSIT